MAARIDGGLVKLLTRSGLNWTEKYPATEAALRGLKVRTAYIDGELCGVRPDGVTSFELMQQASDRGGAGLTFFAFDPPRTRRRGHRSPAAARAQEAVGGAAQKAAGACGRGQAGTAARAVVVNPAFGRSPS
jgi:hypothetical protein